MIVLRPLSADPTRAVALARRAIQARNNPDADAGAFLSMLERDVAEGSASGALRVEGSQVTGIAVWEPPNELGMTLEAVYGVEGRQASADYRAFLTEIQRSAGPILFAPRGLAGLSPDEEADVMAALGFARFGRSEMRYPLETPDPEDRGDRPWRPREARPDDLGELARLHEIAYRDHFDRYLYLASADAGRDAALVIREILEGRWGEFLPWASAVVEEAGNLVAAALVVRGPHGPLIADVMVDPGRRGRGLGRAVLSAAVRALRARKESVIALNVTEGNARAIRLYERLGFVRSAGPSYGWYSRERIPVPPERR
jgi:ribosomal protein S18 acetylase RimI-like enzyme